MGGWDELTGERLSSGSKNRRSAAEGGGRVTIGTAGTSPFGAHGYNPEGVRIGQDKSRHQRAVKVWDKREFRNLDDQVDQLRHAQPEGRDAAPAHNGRVMARRKNSISTERSARRPSRAISTSVHAAGAAQCGEGVLMFLDIGGSMDPRVRVCEELFSGGAHRVQEPRRILLLSQLQLRGRVEGRPAARRLKDPDLGRAPPSFLGRRLQSHHRGRRRDEPLPRSPIRAVRSNTGMKSPAAVWLQRLQSRSVRHRSSADTRRILRAGNTPARPTSSARLSADAACSR